MKSTQQGRRALAITLALAIAPTANVANAAPEVAQVERAPLVPPPPQQGALSVSGARGLDPYELVAGEDAAYERYMAGRKAYDEKDFAAAAEAFETALRKLPEAAPYARSRASLVLLWAQTQAQLYTASGELDLMARERSLLEAYRARMREFAADAADREAKQKLIDDRIAEIDADFARITGNHGDAETQLSRSLEGGYEGVHASTWAPRTSDLAWYRRRDDPRPRADQLTEEERAGRNKRGDTGDARRPGTGLIASGAVVLAVGVAALAVMGAGMAKAKGADDFDAMQSPDARRAQIGRGLAGNAMSVSGAVVGGVAVVTGIVLVALGAKKRRASKLDIAPTTLPQGAGVLLQGRF